MKYWFDTEFIEDGKTIDLISIGIVAEDGREFYAVSHDCDLTKANDWVKEHVLSQLPPLPDPRYSPNYDYDALWTADPVKRPERAWASRKAIKDGLLMFLQPEWSRPLDRRKEQVTNPEFWAYYADYDWVVLCQLFGTMMDLPQGLPQYDVNFPMYCRDIKQWCDQLGNPKLPKQGKGEHNALADARWNRLAWEFLRDYEQKSLTAQRSAR